MPASPDNATIADRLDELAALLDLAGAGHYAVRAYRRAAELVRGTPAPVAELVRRGEARRLRGIGPSIEARLVELVETGTLAEMRHLTDTSIDVTLSGPVPPAGALPGVRDLGVDGQRLRCLVPTAELGALLEALGRSGIVSLVSQPPTLEQLFLRHYDGSDGVPS